MQAAGEPANERGPSRRPSRLPDWDPRQALFSAACPNSGDQLNAEDDDCRGLLSE